MLAHTCFNNELSILDYVLSANSAVKGGLKKRRKTIFSTFPVSETTLSLLFITFLSSLPQQRLSNAHIPKSMLNAMHSSLVCDWSCWFLTQFVCLSMEALLLHIKALGVHSYYRHTPFSTHLCAHQQSWLNDKENCNSQVKRKGDPDIQKMDGTWKREKGRAETEERRQWKIT